MGLTRGLYGFAALNEIAKGFAELVNESPMPSAAELPDGCSRWVVCCELYDLGDDGTTVRLWWEAKP